MRKELSNTAPISSSEKEFYCYTIENFSYDFKKRTTRPWFFDGIIFIFCKEGKIDLELDMENYLLEAPCILSIYPENAIGSINKNGDSIYKASVLFIRRNFLKDLNFNLNVLGMIDITGRRAATINLTQTQRIVITSYFQILDNISLIKEGDSRVLSKNISRSLFESLLYSLLLFSHIQGKNKRKASPNSGKNGYVLEFLELLQSHYKTERTIKYYADEMCISPKYLSLIIKEVTGKGASKWIDDCVIMEAKNLLRYSGMNIQQIAYELNFPNQSAFGKYFKHITGISPSKFKQS